MNIRMLAVPAVLLAAAVCAAPGPSFGLPLPQSFAVAGEMVKASKEKSQDAVLAALYQRLFDLRDKKNGKQIQIDLARNLYRIYMERLKVLSPGKTEEEILQAALNNDTQSSTVWMEQEHLVNAHRELNGINGFLRAMRDIDMEIAFVEQRIVQHAAKKP